MGGREIGGCCKQVRERIFVEVAKIFNSRMTYSNSIKLLPTKNLLAEKMTLKVEIPVFRGSFSRLTFQVRRGPCLIGRVEKSKNGIKSYGYCFLDAFWYVETRKNIFFGQRKFFVWWILT